MALSNMISTDMKALRRMYKTARAQAERDQDSDTEAPCDTQQLLYRSCTTLGVEMRNANDLSTDANKTNAENVNVPRYDENLTT